MATLTSLDSETLKPIRELVYDSLREAIFTGTLKKGERLVETELAEKLNVSRMPVREALRKLEAEGIVEYLPRRGVMVKGFSRDDIIEIYSIRQALEAMAMSVAAARVTPEEIERMRACLGDAERHMLEENAEAVFADHQRFTDMLNECCRMPRLVQLISTYREYLERFRRVTLFRRERQERVLQEHRAILDAVEARDAARVERLVKDHLQAALDAFLRTASLDSDDPQG